MTSPLVTVIMNCFNGAAYLRQAIDSVIAQTWAHWEIVFWDNQSTDESATIVKSYHDPRIRYFYAPSHTLLYEARNYAIEKATGEFLAFLDVDDLWLPEKLERQISHFLDPEVSMVYGNYWVNNERKNKKWVAHKGQLPAGHILDSLLENYKVGLLTLILRQTNPPISKPLFDPRFHIIGDFDLVIRLAARGKIACVQEPVAVYRIHGGNQTSLQRSRHLEELSIWSNEIRMKPTIFASKNINHVQLHAKYINAMGMLLDGKRFEAAKLIIGMEMCILKAKLLIALLLPRFVVLYLKN